MKIFLNYVYTGNTNATKYAEMETWSMPFIRKNHIQPNQLWSLDRIVQFCKTDPLLHTANTYIASYKNAEYDAKSCWNGWHHW